MKVDFLKSLGLDDDVIKQIQAESGKDVTNAKTSMQTQIDSLTEQVTELQGQVTKRDTDLTDLKTQLAMTLMYHYNPSRLLKVSLTLMVLIMVILDRVINYLTQYIMKFQITSLSLNLY